MSHTLDTLQASLDSRRRGDSDTSYVAGLHQRGLNRILEKVGEEAVETILAARDAEGGDEAARRALVSETADLWFHSMVMLSHLGLDHHAVLKELARRQGTSGLDEKAARSRT